MIYWDLTYFRVITREGQRRLSFFPDWRCNSRNVRDSVQCTLNPGSTVQIGRGRGVLDLVYWKIKRSIHNSHEKVLLQGHSDHGVHRCTHPAHCDNAWCLQRILRKLAYLLNLAWYKSSSQGFFCSIEKILGINLHKFRRVRGILC